MAQFGPYTENPHENPSTIFPNHAMQILSSIIHLLGVSILSFCLARRTAADDLATIKGWFDLPWSRLCVILVFIDSWLFLFAAGVLIAGAGLSISAVACQFGIFLCIALYAGSKVLIYAFLIEKVWIVWASNGPGPTPRWSSRVYRICALTMSFYVIMITLMVIGRIAYIREDGTCVIGLKKFSSLPLLSYDLYINIFLTALFLWPLWKSKLLSPSLRLVARRTLIAAFCALTTSTINICVLTILHGQELGWVCLGSCGTDVTVNALALFFVTSSAPPHGNVVMSLPPLTMDPALVGKSHNGRSPQSETLAGRDTYGNMRITDIDLENMQSTERQLASRAYSHAMVDPTASLSVNVVAPPSPRRGNLSVSDLDRDFGHGPYVARPSSRSGPAPSYDRACYSSPHYREPTINVDAERDVARFASRPRSYRYSRQTDFTASAPSAGNGMNRYNDQHYGHAYTYSSPPVTPISPIYHRGIAESTLPLAGNSTRSNNGPSDRTFWSAWGRALRWSGKSSTNAVVSSPAAVGSVRSSQSQRGRNKRDKQVASTGVQVTASLGGASVKNGPLLEVEKQHDAVEKGDGEKRGEKWEKEKERAFDERTTAKDESGREDDDDVKEFSLEDGSGIMVHVLPSVQRQPSQIQLLPPPRSPRISPPPLNSPSTSAPPDLHPHPHPSELPGVNEPPSASDPPIPHGGQ